MKTFAILFLAIIGAGCGSAGCGSHSGQVRIEDVRKTNTLQLVSVRSRIAGSYDIQSGLSLHVYGQLDGTASIYATGWETAKVSGIVDWRIYHDWFQTNCTLHYVPEGVTSSHLTVKYTFH
jgi:hypothetical protein